MHPQQSTQTIRRLLVSGRVQGVGYRFSLRDKAVETGVCGWCRNLPDGRVEAVVAGTPQQVEAVIAWAERGPANAMVDAVTVSDAAMDDMLAEGFEIRQ